MTRKLALVALSLIAVSQAGCLLPELDHAADALDRFSAQIEKTGHPEEGNLRKLIDTTSLELRALIKDARESGKEVTADFMLKWASERKETFEQIRVLSKQVFLDADVLIRQFQVAGLLVPAQFGNELRGFSDDFLRDLRQILSGARIETWAGTVKIGDPKVPLGYSGLTWSEQREGYYSVTFQIQDAHKLHLRVGDGDPIAQADSPKAGEAVYRVPVTPEMRQRFQDRVDMLLGFSLVDAEAKKPPKEWSPRYVGWARLTARFPITYEFKVIDPGTGPAGQLRHIDEGTAIESLVKSAVGSGVILAERHGAIYRNAKTYLPVGASKVSIPKDATWSLKVGFPDGRSEDLTSGKMKVQNSFGQISVTPSLAGGFWTLLIDVNPK
jgi:hypothetical protein